MYNSQDDLVKYSVITIIGVILLVFLIICIKSGYSFGSALGEFIYNLKH